MRRESRKKEKVVWKYNASVTCSYFTAVLQLQVEDIYVEKGVHHPVIELKNRQASYLLRIRRGGGGHQSSEGSCLFYVGHVCNQRGEMRKMQHRPRYSNNELEGAFTLQSSVTEGRGVLVRDDVLFHWCLFVLLRTPSKRNLFLNQILCSN